MNRLKDNRCYLAGAMDRVADGGVGWRKMVKEELNGLGIIFFDPTDKPKCLGIEDKHTRKIINTAKEKFDFDKVARLIKPIRGVDLRMIDKSDFMIVFLDKENNGFGTIEEISLANSQKKPILICQEGGKREAPNWLFGMIPHETIFSRWTDLIVYIRHIHEDKVIDTLNRWVFFK